MGWWVVLLVGLLSIAWGVVGYKHLELAARKAVDWMPMPLDLEDAKMMQTFAVWARIVLGTIVAIFALVQLLARL